MDSILYSSKYNVSYVFTHKVACTTIRKSLLPNTQAPVHDPKVFDLPVSAEMPFFALTRNPYSRALSGYTDKIGKNRKNSSTWSTFAKKYSLNKKPMLSFYEFLEILYKDKDRKNYDSHFRPQIYILHTDNIEYNYLGRIENMEDLVDYLREYGVELITCNSHKTGALNDYRTLISKQEEELINEIYREDFETFGYEMKLESQFVPLPIRNEKRKISKFYQLLFFAYSCGVNRNILNKFRNSVGQKNIDSAKINEENILMHIRFDILKSYFIPQYLKFVYFWNSLLTRITQSKKKQENLLEFKKLINLLAKENLEDKDISENILMQSQHNVLKSYSLPLYLKFTYFRLRVLKDMARGVNKQKCKKQKFEVRELLNSDF